MRESELETQKQKLLKGRKTQSLKKRCLICDFFCYFFLTDSISSKYTILPCAKLTLSFQNSSCRTDALNMMFVPTWLYTIQPAEPRSPERD